MNEIRNPLDNELQDCARLVYISGKELLEFIFAGMHSEILMIFFNKKGTTFSRENILVSAEDGSVKGMVIAYPVPEEKAMAKKMLGLLRDLYKITKLKGLIKIIGRMGLNRHFPKKDNDEYFISNLAVYEEHRGRGIGSGLLHAVEKDALDKGLGKISLYVEIDNTRARNLYEKFGFSITDKAILPESYNGHGIYGFHKMVKNISCETLLK